MIKKQFYEFFQQIYPFADLKDQLTKFLDQFDKDDSLLVETPSDELIQGDILEGVPSAYYVYENGEMVVKTEKVKAMILSNSCDITRKPKILLAPIQSISDIDTDYRLIMKNKIFNLLFINEIGYQEEAVFFDNTFSIDAEILKDRIAENKTEKIAELSQFGYYLMISKLSLYLIRQESDDVKRK